MNTVGRVLFVANIPLTLVLLCWVWVGRLVFGVGGWFLMVIPLMVFPFALPALAISTAVTVATSRSPRQFTRMQTLAHVVMWSGLFGVGLFLPDFGDAPGSTRSFLTQVFGHSDQLLELSGQITLCFAAVAIAGWITTLVTAALAGHEAGRRDDRERRFRGAR